MVGSGASKKRRTGTRVARHVRPSVLILECDPAKLAAQSLTSARQLDRIVATVVPSAQRYPIAATCRQALLSQLAQCKEECGKVDVVVICGHSNKDKLCLTADWRAPWNEVAQWIAPFSPKSVVLVACQAGRWLPSKALFDGVLTLREIYGSPASLTDQQAILVQLLVPYLLSNGRLKTDVSRMLQFANFALTRGVIFRQTRREFQQSAPAGGLVWTGIESLLQAYSHR